MVPNWSQHIMCGWELSSLIVILSLPSPPQASSEGMVVILDFRPSRLLQKSSPLDRHFFFFSKVAKPVLCQKVCFKTVRSYTWNARVFEGIKWQRLKSLKNLWNLLYFLLFVSYGSVKILTSHFPRGILLQIRLAVSWNFFKITIILHAINIFYSDIFYLDHVIT